MAATKSAWIDAVDTTSGVRFQLPSEPVRNTQTTPGGVDERLYSAQVDGDVGGVAAGVIDAGSAAQSATALASYADAIQARFRAAGAPKDFALTEKRDCMFSGHPCQDMRIGFTPLSEPAVSLLWLIRVLVDGPEVVLVQTVVSAPKSEQVEDLALIRTIQHRAVLSVGLP